jgi:hypothetical protein
MRFQTTEKSFKTHITSSPHVQESRMFRMLLDTRFTGHDELIHHRRLFDDYSGIEPAFIFRQPMISRRIKE